MLNFNKIILIFFGFLFFNFLFYSAAQNLTFYKKVSGSFADDEAFVVGKLIIESAQKESIDELEKFINPNVNLNDFFSKILILKEFIPSDPVALDIIGFEIDKRSFESNAKVLYLMEFQDGSSAAIKVNYVVIAEEYRILDFKAYEEKDFDFPPYSIKNITFWDYLKSYLPN